MNLVMVSCEGLRNARTLLVPAARPERRNSSIVNQDFFIKERIEALWPPLMLS
jgi:hypothetical protein